jgi:hypothetical protein
MKDKNNRRRALTSIQTHYEIDGDEIVIYHSYHEPRRLKYTKQIEKDTLEIMHQEAIARSNYQDIFSSQSNSYLMHTIAEGALAATNASLLLFNTNNYVKGLNIFAALFCGTYAAFFSDQHSIAKERLNEIKKYSLFFDWEEEINKEMIKRYHELYGEDAPIEEANKMTLNDLEDYTLTEVQEIVENISKSKRLSLRAK